MPEVKFPFKKPELLFYTQVTAALLLIITALLNLTIPGLCDNPEERGYWKIGLSATIGYLFPCPKLKRKNGLLSDSSQQLQQ